MDAIIAQAAGKTPAHDPALGLGKQNEPKPAPGSLVMLRHGQLLRQVIIMIIR